MRLVITGAAGKIGSRLVDELSPFHELHLIDRRPLGEGNSTVDDLSRERRTSRITSWLNRRILHWSDTFKGADAVIHLAANPRPSASWNKLFPDNVQATWHIIEAAAKFRVPRVVFASSVWVVRALEQKLAPACYSPDGPKIDSDVLPCPVNAYGLSKVFGEAAGRMFVDDKQLSSFIAIRIGNFDSMSSDDAILNSQWIGVDDMRSLVRCCVEAELNGFHAVYGVSAQPSAPYDLSHARSLLSWEPKQMR